MKERINLQLNGTLINYEGDIVALAIDAYNPGNNYLTIKRKSNNDRIAFELKNFHEVIRFVQSKCTLRDIIERQGGASYIKTTFYYQKDSTSRNNWKEIEFNKTIMDDLCFLDDLFSKHDV